jgi:hypothetical protein
MSHICMGCMIIIVSVCYVCVWSVVIDVVMWSMRIRIDMRNVVVTGRIIDVKAALERTGAKRRRRIGVTCTV